MVVRGAIDGRPARSGQQRLLPHAVAVSTPVGVSGAQQGRLMPARAREYRMSGYRRILLLALAVLVGAAILGGALRQLTGASVHRSATHPAAPTAASALWS